ncbi:hypothetical protein PISMIDRAFT_689165, partial [Pisolithus microcarpus 441]
IGTGHLLSICNLDILIFSGSSATFEVLSQVQSCLAKSLANFQQCTTHSTLSIGVSYTVSGSTIQEIFAFWCREGVGDDWVDILELDGLIGGRHSATSSSPPSPCLTTCNHCISVNFYSGLSLFWDFILPNPHFRMVYIAL